MLMMGPAQHPDTWHCFQIDAAANDEGFHAAIAGYNGQQKPLHHGQVTTSDIHTTQQPGQDHADRPHLDGAAQQSTFVM